MKIVNNKSKQQTEGKQPQILTCCRYNPLQGNITIIHIHSVNKPASVATSILYGTHSTNTE